MAVHSSIRTGLFTRLIGSSNTFRTAIQIDLGLSTYGYKLYYNIASQNVIGAEIITGTLASGYKYIVTLGTVEGNTIGTSFTSDGTGTCSVSNNVRPEQPLTLPYVVMDILPINPSLDSASKYYECLIQFNIAHSTLALCETLTGYLNDRLDDSLSSLSFAGYTATRFDRRPEVPLGIIDNVWNIVAQYGLYLQKN